MSIRFVKPLFDVTKTWDVVLKISAHMQTESSHQRMCSRHRLIKDDAFIVLFVLRKSRLSESTVKTESVVPDEPLRTAQANLGRHCFPSH